ncbi:MAG: apolipoprotein N-acyltransferase [Pseudomonadota bacterium]
MTSHQGLRPLVVLVLAPFAGALITLSLAPFNFWPAGIISCALYAYLLCTCSVKQAIWRSWLFGVGMFGTGVSWVYVSIEVYGGAGPLLAGFLIVLFCAGLSVLYQVSFGWFYVRFVRALPGGMLVGFPATWVLAEWLRSWLLTGFPWLYLGYAHLDTPIAGWAPVVGVYGLSFVCALTGTCLFLAWRSRTAIACTTYAVIVLTLWIGGAVLKPIEWVVRASETPLNVVIYQPNVPQEHKWDRDWYQPILRQLRTGSEPHYGADLLIWPEAAIPNFYQRAQGFLGPIARRAETANTTLFTGIPYLVEEGAGYYNSVVALGQGEGVYHKQHLVPFGEYVPLEGLLRGLIAFFDLPMSAFSAGGSDQPPLRAGSYRVAPYVCYEVVYPQMVARSARQADLLLTVSNDAWFGHSIGPLQHLQMAQMRALENGRYMIRGTNNGVSAIINQRGQIIAQADQHVEATLIGQANVMMGHTPFASFGVIPVVAGCAIALVLMALMYFGFWRDKD